MHCRHIDELQAIKFYVIATRVPRRHHAVPWYTETDRQTDRRV